ncbi:anhydro-N-acetylmuramic acid kinase [Yoonia litorea]|uniref:Anhydro-N-acetylmuramic acid kinase n=1 Tax=Yoonia litorea TaxID=1123755 RepID=A0A1I6M9R4_9RHOB|nr:anhydro-N-acetylmuramic acid kinase [Yoonia litorea]SFS12464.1 anhydro-N-acetylmuramic acid kinase [Yoonia litorea]
MFEGRFERILGLMSGTSLDGVDAAVIETDGETIRAFGQTAYRAYSDAERATLKAALGQWQTDDVRAAADVVEAAHLAVMADFHDIALVGFHGQTLAHDPDNRQTHQCGDGQRIADQSGLPVAWDFRSADVAAGGQGAPLAPFYHFALAKWLKETKPVGFLNLGGVGNLTFVDPTFEKPSDTGALLAFDTGPANAPMNDLMQKRRGLSFDAGGLLASKGQEDRDFVEDFMSHPYFEALPPKSLDRNSFEDVLARVDGFGDADALATLVGVVVASVKRGCAQCPVFPARIYVAGGGRHNKTLMQRLETDLPCPVVNIDDVGLNGDMIEAQAFAFLAARVARGLPISAPGTSGVDAPLQGGRLVHPAAKSPYFGVLTVPLGRIGG